MEQLWLGLGLGFNPWFWGGGGPGFNNTLSTQTEGTLYINIIDATTKQLVWQGKGKGGLNENYKKGMKELHFLYKK